MKFRKLAAVFVSAVVLAACVGCGKAAKSVLPFDKNAAGSDTPESIVASNEKFELCWNDNNKSVYLKEKQSGTMWGTTADAFKNEKTDEWGDPLGRHPLADSMLTVEYIAADTGNAETAISYTGVNQNGRIICDMTDNGITVSYYFDELSVMIPVRFTLTDSGLSLTVDPSKIQEGKNELVSIGIAPFMCSLENDVENTYLFYPSGSGALIKPISGSSQGTGYQQKIYGADPSVEQWDKPFDEPSVKMPVYGYRGENKGGVCIISSGAENGIISTSYGSVATGYSTVYAKMQFRGYTNNISDVVGGNRVKNQVYATQSVKTPFQIDFYPLSGEENGYMGMAAVYRDYLRGKYELRETAEDKLLNVKFIGGLTVKKSFLGIPYNSLYCTTPLSRANEITTDLLKLTDNITVELFGYGKNGASLGAYAGGFKTAYALGGGKKLKEFAEYCSGNNIDLYYDADFINYKNSAGGINSFFDRAEAASHKIAYTYLYDKATLGRDETARGLLVARDKLSDGVNKFVKELSDSGVNGIGITSLSSIAYSDYNDKSSAEYYACSNMARDVVNAVSDIHKSGKSVLADSANDYAAAAADIIKNAPSASSRADVFSADIPFYQIVFKGVRPISGEAVNLAADWNKAFLYSVETGSGLSYTLISDYDKSLLDSDYPIFYDSLYGDIKSKISKDIEAYKELFGKVSKQSITAHSLLRDGLHKTEFSNGITVFVNYSEQDISCDLGTVQAGGFIYGGEQS